MKGKSFKEQERQILEDIILHRRTELGDNFIDREIPNVVLERLLWSALQGPSVGFSQPWEFVIIRDQSIKEKIKACFEIENEKARKIFSDKPSYNRLNLEAINITPINIAVFYKPSSTPILGQTSMNKMGVYSVCLAVQNLWLMARAENLAISWVSLLDENKVKDILHAPAENELVAYLCIGYVKEFTELPQLEIANWEKRKRKEEVIYYNSYNHPQ
ncbi:MAG: 5,6-dimethylbenzimidazole synthase [Symploca sp. SIO2E9]|nr:5,6-dimethylbenzimidazole synthase [Symploca sp. SIO2E9]